MTERPYTVARLLSRDEVLEYLGRISPPTLSRWIKDGIVPGPAEGTKKWDRRQIDVWLDRRAGIEGNGERPNLARQALDARKAEVRHKEA